jgi:antitoxin FitA
LFLSIDAHGDPDQVIARAKKLKRQAKGSLTLQDIQQAIDQGRP